MGTFSLFETFFFLTLAILFILILLLIYHFKDRLNKVEQKCDSMFDIIQDMSQQLLENNRNSYIFSPTMDPYNLQPAVKQDTLETKTIELDNLAFEENNICTTSKNDDSINDSDIDDSDIDESDDESEDSESEVQEYEEVEEDDDDEEEVNIEKITIPDIEETEEKVDYKKMNVADLRELAKSKGHSVNGLKKNELINVLSQ